jgi:hypothetical protein
MDAVIIINNETIPISWKSEIGKCAVLYVHAPGIIYATAAVQFLLNQLGYHHLWYGNDIICKKGVFQFEIVEVKEANRCNFN